MFKNPEIMRKGKRKEDSWQFHFNDWMDNGTFHPFEEDEPSEREVSEREAEEQKMFFLNRKIKKNDFASTGRFDQFNDEFDGNFNMHSYDNGERDIVKDDESPGSTPPQDEYGDEDPYKINGLE